jgi:SPP1 gp7 family putative phage head morphogenesis protein
MTLRQIRGSAAIEAAYRKKLLKILDEVHTSTLYWIRARYRQYESRIVGDAAPASALAKEIKELFTGWGKALKDTPTRVAEWFAKTQKKYTDTAMKAALKSAGFTVQLKNTRRVNDIMRAAVNSNVGLIKKIPAEYLTRVETLVNQSVLAGRDMETIIEGIEKIHESGRAGAIIVARDQVNKATQAMTQARYEDFGIKRAVWRHNAGGSKTYRPTHLEMDGEQFDIEQGMYDPDVGDYIQPGFLINCRCSYQPVIEGIDVVRPDAEWRDS